MPNKNMKRILSKQTNLQQRVNNQTKELIPILENYLKSANKHLRAAKNVGLFGSLTGNRAAHLSMAESTLNAALSMAERINNPKRNK